MNKEVMKLKNPYRYVKREYKPGDKIVFREVDTSDDERRRNKRKVGTIIRIYPYYTLVDLGKYKTCIHNHQMITDSKIRRLVG